MGGNSKNGGGEAKQARKDEQARQDRIRQGTQRINNIFDGSWGGAGQLGAGTAFDPNATYYNADGSVWSAPTGTAGNNPAAAFLSRQLSGNARDNPQQPQGEGSWMLKRGPHGDSERVWTPSPNAGSNTGLSAQEKAFQEALAGGQLYSGRQQADGFNDSFFNSRKQAYIDYATPQLEDQYGKAQRELTFALDRAGLLDSSVRGQKLGELQQMYDTNKQQVADQALAYENESRNAVEDARQNLISTLNATGDAEGAANSAIARSQALSQPASFSPLSNLFVDFTNTLGTQAALERANAASGGQTPVRYQTGLFGSGKNSTVVK